MESTLKYNSAIARPQHLAGVFRFKYSADMVDTFGNFHCYFCNTHALDIPNYQEKELGVDISDFHVRKYFLSTSASDLLHYYRKKEI